MWCELQHQGALGHLDEVDLLEVERGDVHAAERAGVLGELQENVDLGVGELEHAGVAGDAGEVVLVAGGVADEEDVLFLLLGAGDDLDAQLLLAFFEAEVGDVGFLCADEVGGFEEAEHAELVDEALDARVVGPGGRGREVRVLGRRRRAAAAFVGEAERGSDEPPAIVGVFLDLDHLGFLGGSSTRSRRMTRLTACSANSKSCRERSSLTSPKKTLSTEDLLMAKTRPG